MMGSFEPPCDLSAGVLLQKQAHNGLVSEIGNYGPLFQRGESPAGKGGSE